MAYNEIWELPPGVTISARALEVHKIDYRRIQLCGLHAAPQLRVTLAMLRRLRERGVPIVAHNGSFDTRLLQQTATKHGVDEWDLKASDVFCTMISARSHAVFLSKTTGRHKNPSNVELFKYLHGHEPAFGSLHDALTDVRVTASCFVRGVGRGWWTL